MVDPTPHWGIHKWDDTAPAAPLEDFFNTQADDLEAALDGAATGWFLRYATKAAMDAVPGTAVGQHATVYADSTAANNGDYTWNGTAWITNRLAADIATFGTGWTSLTGGHKARVRRHGDLVTTHGAIQFGTGANYNNMFTVPSGFAPVTTSVQFIGMAMASIGSGNGVALELVIAAGVVSFAGSGYSTGSNPPSAIVALGGCQWSMD